jgi:hypothetical protein
MKRQHFIRVATSGISGAYLSCVARARADANQNETERTTSMTTVAQESTGDAVAVRAFPRLAVPEAELVGLRGRIEATIWPSRELVDDDSQGVQLATMRALADYWANGYDWRKIEARLNATPQFVTEIDGVDIHFIHVRSKHEHALPLIITHGWP